MIPVLLAGVAAGSALRYFLDRESGAQRRADAGQKLGEFKQNARQFVDRGFDKVKTVTSQLAENSIGSVPNNVGDVLRNVVGKKDGEASQGMAFHPLTPGMKFLYLAGGVALFVAAFKVKKFRGLIAEPLRATGITLVAQGLFSPTSSSAERAPVDLVKYNSEERGKHDESALLH